MSTVFAISADPSFGVLVSFGIGGVATELLDDRAYRAVPLTDVDAAELISAPRAAPLLNGYRGARVVAREPLIDLALRLSDPRRRPAGGVRPAVASGARRAGRRGGDQRHRPDRPRLAQPHVKRRLH